jgi:hypothetical protein
MITRTMICVAMSYMISIFFCYRCYPCPTSSGFDTQLYISVCGNICICIRSYPYLNSNKNIKTNMVSVIYPSIFDRIRSDDMP